MKFIKSFVEKNFAKSLSINIALVVVGAIAQSISSMPLALGMLIVGCVGMCVTLMSGIAYLSNRTENNSNIVYEEYKSETTKEHNQIIKQTSKNIDHVKEKNIDREI